jgi:N-acyl-L-homoserine lactone synthetase
MLWQLHCACECPELSDASSPWIAAPAPFLIDLIRKNSAKMLIENLSSQRAPLTLKACPLVQITPLEVLTVFRSRFRIYAKHDLINRHERQTPPEREILRRALAEEHVTPAEDFDPKDHQLDCDYYDFDAACRHVLIQSGPRLLAYFRIIHDTGMRPLPMQELYGAEYRDFRAKHPSASIAEFSRLIIEIPQSPEISAIARDSQIKLGLRISLRLFQVMSQYARKNGLTDIFAQTHPAHAPMYIKHFFNVIGEEKNYKSVNNHPAVLLHHHVQ